MTTVLERLVPVVVVAVLLAVACGGGDLADESAGESAARSTVVSATPTPDSTPVPTLEPTPFPTLEPPIPVEPDDGIGDGAEPLPGAEVDPGPAGDWHGAETAVTNCPGIDFQRVEASAFSFSVPVDFVDQQAQGLDSEIAIWSDGSIEASFDYGWYSNPLDTYPAENLTAIDFSGFVGRLVVVPEAAVNIVGVHFPVVETGDFQPDRLTLIVRYEDGADEIIGRCIVSSIEWKVSPPS
ncbi:MAG: hypothetical protein AAF567_22760 [Actinomycetota bacterium]